MVNQAITAKRKLGSMEVSAIGFGCMSLSGVYGTSDDRAGIELIAEALDHGVTLLIRRTPMAWGTTRNWSAGRSDRKSVV